MKYIILVPDGMADVPVDELNGRTCMEAANIPNMDMVARKGKVGTVKNVPRGMQPASDVANLSILGYDPRKYYCGRGPFEAANLNVALDKNNVAFRFNTITVSENKMADYSAGHISTAEVKLLVDVLNEELGDERYSFYAGCSYRNLLKVTCSSPEEADMLSDVQCSPPHDILDKPLKKFMPKNDELTALMERSRELFKNHDVNKVRVDLGQNPADMIWLWGQGKKPDMPVFKDAYGITGGIISAVDLIKGIGKILELEVVDVPGATGYYDTNYEGKADAALEVLKHKDLVFVHVEAPDEAGHNGDILAKINAIENFDSKIVGKIVRALTGRESFRILLLPDHPTPVYKRTHTIDPVPFAVAGDGITADEVAVFSENSAKAGSLNIKNGHELMGLLLGDKL